MNFKNLFLKHVQLTKEYKESFLIYDQNINFETSQIKNAKDFLDAFDLQSDEKYSGFGDLQYMTFTNTLLPFNFYAPYEKYTFKNTHLTLIRIFTSPLLLKMFPNKSVFDFNFFQFSYKKYTSKPICPFLYNNNSESVYITKNIFYIQDENYTINIKKQKNKILILINNNLIKTVEFVKNNKIKLKQIKNYQNRIIKTHFKDKEFTHQINYYKYNLFNKIILNLSGPIQLFLNKTNIKRLFPPLQRIKSIRKKTTKSLVPSILFIVCLFLFIIFCIVFFCIKIQIVLKEKAKTLNSPKNLQNK